MAIAIVAGGCFWCIETAFNSLRGVTLAESGYIGGHTDNPTYEQVCSGATGHAEAVRITYDPAVIRHEDILDIFFELHDPTQLNRQGNDVGTQYRSAIFVSGAAERAAAEEAIARHQPRFAAAICTEIAETTTFYVAEAYHQDYFNREGGQSAYCAYVVAPKLAKFRKGHADRLK